METPVFLAVLAAALLHASWNSVIQNGLDRFSSVVLLAVVQATIAIPILPFVPLPSVESIGWIVAAAGLHTGYKLFLVQAYAHADLSQAYPLARGTAPLLVSLFSVTALGVAFEGYEVMAILAISIGILLMAFKGAVEGRMRGNALFYALATAVFIASYTLVDGIGARIAGTPSGYVLWMVVGDAMGMMAFATWSRGRSAFPALVHAWRSGVAAGAMSLGSYWIAVWAYTQAPIALVATLRQSSILFAILIAAFVMHEPVSRWRWASAVVIALGVAAMRL